MTLGTQEVHGGQRRSPRRARWCAAVTSCCVRRVIHFCRTRAIRGPLLLTKHCVTQASVGGSEGGRRSEFDDVSQAECALQDLVVHGQLGAAAHTELRGRLGRQRVVPPQPVIVRHLKRRVQQQKAGCNAFTLPPFAATTYARFSPRSAPDTVVPSATCDDATATTPTRNTQPAQSVWSRCCCRPSSTPSQPCTGRGWGRHQARATRPSRPCRISSPSSSVISSRPGSSSTPSYPQQWNPRRAWRRLSGLVAGGGGGDDRGRGAHRWNPLDLVAAT